MKSDETIPEQHKGASSDVQDYVDNSTLRQAHSTFVEAARRLLNVNDWQSISGPTSAGFQLSDANGEKLDRVAKPGDYIRINIPGPGNIAGEGYDWVRIEEIEDKPNPAADSECLAIRVRPVSSPINQEHDVAHFFDDSATSTFMIERHDLRVVASVHGRNEVPNTDVDRPIDKVRNAVIANVATSGLSAYQWSLLTKGLVKDL